MVNDEHQCEHQRNPLDVALAEPACDPILIQARIEYLRLHSAGGGQTIIVRLCSLLTRYVQK